MRVSREVEKTIYGWFLSSSSKGEEITILFFGEQDIDIFKFSTVKDEGKRKENNFCKFKLYGIYIS